MVARRDLSAFVGAGVFPPPGPPSPFPPSPRAAAPPGRGQTPPPQTKRRTPPSPPPPPPPPPAARGRGGGRPPRGGNKPRPYNGCGDRAHHPAFPPSSPRQRVIAVLASRSASATRLRARIMPISRNCASGEPSASSAKRRTGCRHG